MGNSNKRLLDASFKILRNKKKNSIKFPIFLFQEVSNLDIDSIKMAIFSRRYSSLFFVYDSRDFTIVPLSKAALNFFLKKRETNLVLYNSPIEEIENSEGKIVTLHYEDEA